MDQDFFNKELSDRLPAQLKDEFGNINFENYKQYLNRQHTSILDYEQDNEEEFKRELFQAFVKSSYYCPQNKVKELIQKIFS